MKHSICFYLHNYPNYGGIEKVTTHLANYFVANGNDVCIFSYISKNEEKLLSFLHPTIIVEKALNVELLDSNENYAHLKEFLKCNRVDTVIFQDSYAPVEQILFRCKNELHFKLIIAEHNTPDCDLLSWKYAKPLLALEKFKYLLLYYPILWKVKRKITSRHWALYKECDYYALLSDKYIPIFEQISRIGNHPKLGVIYNPLTSEISNRTVTSKSDTCLFCARFSSQKGIEKLLDIWKEVEQIESNWKLNMVGDGPLLGYAKQYVKRYHLKRVVFEGYQTDTRRYYSSSSIFLMTSLYEGWPLTLFEAMSQGCVPILYDSFAAASDIVYHGRNGFVIPKFDKEQYVSTLIGIMRNKKKRNEMSRSAIKSCEQYSIDDIGKKWIQLIDKL